MKQIHKIIIGVLVAYILYRMFVVREGMSSTDIGLYVILAITLFVVVLFVGYFLGFVAI
jgi:hypothetical protein